MQSKFEARKSLGQHFLRSEKAINQIVDAIVPSPEGAREHLERSRGLGRGLVFEIGPGEGVLTQRLLEAGHKVIVIEIDQRSVEVLENDFRDYISTGQLKIINKDCLDVSYVEELGTPLIKGVDTTKGSAGDFVLVGNIPYYITGAIFRHTFEQKVLPKQAIFLVQKEVAQRVVAREKGKAEKESLLSVSVKIFVENDDDVEIVDYVKAGSFAPPPKVDSAILNIKNIRNPFTPLPEGVDTKRSVVAGDFWLILKAAFSQKRKFLMSNLKNKLVPEAFEKYKNIFEEVFVKKYGEKVRAEDVGTSDWKNLISKI